MDATACFWQRFTILSQGPHRQSGKFAEREPKNRGDRGDDGSNIFVYLCVKIALDFIDGDGLDCPFGGGNLFLTFHGETPAENAKPLIIMECKDGSDHIPVGLRVDFI